MANGIYTNSELVDSIIVDLNNLIKEQLNGQYINACGIVHQMAQKLVNLRQTIDNDLKNRDETIETLKQELRSAGVDVVDMSAQEFVEKIEKDGGGVGGNNA